MKNFLLQMFTWWNGQTIGTRFFTWRKGEFVGQDEAGNRYYREREGRRRWVIYKRLAESSSVPPEWHGWLHHMLDKTPLEEDYERRPWEKPWVGNRTGTHQAYRPPGSIARGGKRPAASGDYEAWKPE